MKHPKLFLAGHSPRHGRRVGGIHANRTYADFHREKCSSGLRNQYREP